MSTYNQILRYEADEDDDEAKAPREFTCAISQQLMHDPVVASDGETYERWFIENWIKKETNRHA